MISLFNHQKIALSKLRSGSILCGGVGSGKSRTAVAFYYKECGGDINIDEIHLPNPLDLYIITTARKRDSFDWEEECLPFLLSSNEESSLAKVTIDSWNNLHKYKNIKHGFFIFDEQRVVGSGQWVKSFLQITKTNKWILLSATPGDTWMDYIPVFIANGYYKNRTEFIDKHVLYEGFSKYPKIKQYVGVTKLIHHREEVVVKMPFKKHTRPHEKKIIAEYDKETYRLAMKKRWNPYTNAPIKNISELCYTLRKIVNSDESRLNIVRQLFLEGASKIIIFYNFDYELELLIKLGKDLNVKTNQWNGHKHEEVPSEHQWLYLVQYFAGAEAWNCIRTNIMIFYSQNYSYKTMIQAAGRIDRLNTSYIDLYYYHLRSNAPIDIAIEKALNSKQSFNERLFLAE